MLHQPADHICPSAPPAEFDTAAYVADLRAAGAELVELDHDFALHLVGAGKDAALAAVEARWRGLVDTDARRKVCCFLENERGIAEAAALIGFDLSTGLVEARRLEAVALAAYEHERLNPDCNAADKAADVAGHDYHYVVMHTAALPARTATELAIKAQFALEHRAYTTDEDFAGDVLKEVVEFFAPDYARPVLQAAE